MTGSAARTSQKTFLASKRSTGTLNRNVRKPRGVRINIGVACDAGRNEGKMRCMRVISELRADGVYVAAGVELIEPEQYGLAHGATRLNERFGWQTAKRLRAAIGDPDGHAKFRRPLVLQTCVCSAHFVGDVRSRYCPACAREAAHTATRGAERRRRAKRRPLIVARCRQCGRPTSVARSTKVSCSARCRVAAHRQRKALGQPDS
jgi:hypothetical protein